MQKSFKHQLIIGKYYLIDCKRLSKNDSFFLQKIKESLDSCDELRYAKFQGYYKYNRINSTLSFYFPLIPEFTGHSAPCFITRDKTYKDSECKSFYIDIEYVIREMTEDELFIERL